MIEKVGIYHYPKRKRPWIIRWYEEPDATGKAARRSKSFSLKREAQRFRTAKQREFDEGVRRKQYDLSLAELCDKVLANIRPILRHKSVQCYENTISQLLSHFGPNEPIRKIGPEQAERFIVSRKLVHQAHIRTGKGLSAWGRNQHLRVASATFARAITWGYLRVNPFSTVRRVAAQGRRWHHITPSEFEAIMRVTPDCRTRAFYAAMYGCGLRFGEAISFLWNGRDIDFERGLVEVANREGTADIPPFFVKDHELRCVPLPKWVQQLLLEAQAEAAEGCPFVFLTEERWRKVRAKWQLFQREDRTKTWKNTDVCNNVLRNFKVCCRRAGIATNDKLTIHGLRKSYAQNLADAGTPIHTLKKLMGHSSVKTLECYYIRSTDANEAQARKVLDGLFPSQIGGATALTDSAVNQLS